MGVFWSGTDNATMTQLSNPGWFLSTVFNKKYETRTAIQMGKPFGLLVDELPLQINHALPNELTDQWDKEYQENVKNVSFRQPETGGSRTRVWDATTDSWQ